MSANNTRTDQGGTEAGAWTDAQPPSEIERAKAGAVEFLSRRFALTDGDGAALGFQVEFFENPVAREAKSPALAVRVHGELPVDGGELYAQEIVGRLGIAQSAVSRHLGQLERAGLIQVEPRRGTLE